MLPQQFAKCVVASIVILLCLNAGATFAQQSVVIATVNDQPITSFDVDQRIRLLRTLGQPESALNNRKKIANDLINDVIKIEEAKRNKMDPTPAEVAERLKRIAQGMKMDESGLIAKLKAQGISVSAFSNYTAAQMAFGRLLSGKFREKVTVDQAAVDRKMSAITQEINGKLAKIKLDPRMQPLTVYSILEINFPVEGNDQQLMQSRAIEANQYVQRFKTCSNPRGPATGIFNVKIGKKLEADSRKLPAQMRTLFQTKGPGHAFGPMRGPGGVQVLAFCSQRSITPQMPKAQMPTRTQIENVVLNENYDVVEQKYLAIMRKTAIIEYKDQSYAQ